MSRNFGRRLQLELLRSKQLFGLHRTIQELISLQCDERRSPLNYCAPPLSSISLIVSENCALYPHLDGYRVRNYRSGMHYVVEQMLRSWSLVLRQPSQILVCPRNLNVLGSTGAYHHSSLRRIKWDFNQQDFNRLRRRAHCSHSRCCFAQ
jgi:hypothetical protein